jgi:hypothetical protein
VGMRGVRRDTWARESDKEDMIEKEENGVRNKQSDGAGMCGEATERERESDKVNFGLQSVVRRRRGERQRCDEEFRF